MLAPWKKSYDQPRQYIQKQRHYFTNKGLCSQSYGFSGSHVWMWEFNYKETWASNNWCFWTVVLEKTLESPWTARRSKQSILKEISPEYSLEGLMLKLKLQNFGHLMQELTHWKRPLMQGKIEGRRRRAWQRMMVGRHHWLDRHKFQQALGVADGQGSLACCNLCGCNSHTWLIDWPELISALQKRHELVKYHTLSSHVNDTWPYWIGRDNAYMWHEKRITPSYITVTAVMETQGSQNRSFTRFTNSHLFWRGIYIPVTTHRIYHALNQLLPFPILRKGTKLYKMQCKILPLGTQLKGKGQKILEELEWTRNNCHLNIFYSANSREIRL